LLYVSTRTKLDSYTAHRALHEEYAPDGGQYVPFRLPVFTQEELDALQDKSFGQIIAQTLNLFFSARLTGWDVECCVGRSPVRIERMGHRLMVAEAWHNPEGNYSNFEDALYNRVCADTPKDGPTAWAKIAIRIALLFALAQDIRAAGVEQFDVAVNTADFLQPMAAYYAKMMGLPVGKIICACNDNGAAWDLIHRGEFNTNPPLIRTQLPLVDIARPQGIEQLILAALGEEELKRYLTACDKGGVYRLDEEQTLMLSSGLFAAVVGADRIQSVINSMYRTNQYLIDPYTALTYGGLQDYRSRTGESQFALIISHADPVQYADKIGSAIGISPSELRVRIRNSKE